MKPSTNKDAAPVILVLEHDAFLRIAAARVLRAAGFEVTETEHVQAALKIVQRQPVSLILSDVNLDAPGLEWLVARLDECPRECRVPLIAMSGEAPPRELQTYIGSQYLPKPFTMEELLAAVSRVLPLPKHPHRHAC